MEFSGTRLDYDFERNVFVISSGTDRQELGWDEFVRLIEHHGEMHTYGSRFLQWVTEVLAKRDYEKRLEDHRLVDAAQKLIDDFSVNNS